MLVLSRRPGESVTILVREGLEVVVTVDQMWFANGRVSLGFEAPTEVAIIRTELMERDSAAALHPD